MVLASKREENKFISDIKIYVEGMVASVVTKSLNEVLEDNMRGLRSVIAPSKMRRQNHFKNPRSPELMSDN